MSFFWGSFYGAFIVFLVGIWWIKSLVIGEGSSINEWKFWWENRPLPALFNPKPVQFLNYKKCSIIFEPPQIPLVFTDPNDTYKILWNIRWHINWMERKVCCWNNTFIVVYDYCCDAVVWRHTWEPRWLREFKKKNHGLQGNLCKSQFKEISKNQ